LFIATFAVAILIVLAQTIPAHLFVGWGILLALLMIVVVTGIASTRAIILTVLDFVAFSFFTTRSLEPIFQQLSLVDAR